MVLFILIRLWCLTGLLIGLHWEVAVVHGPVAAPVSVLLEGPVAAAMGVDRGGGYIAGQGEVGGGGGGLKDEFRLPQSWDRGMGV